MENQQELILKYLDEEEIRTQLINQLQKDFSSFGFEFSIRSYGREVLQDLLPQMVHCVQQLSQSNYTQFLNLLYRIDLPEERLKRALHENNGLKSDSEIIAELIIKRELQKVVYKKIYK